MGYELALHNENHWDAPLEAIIVSFPEYPRKPIRKLSNQDINVQDQLQIFEEITSLKRRTFFKYRREMNIKWR